MTKGTSHENLIFAKDINFWAKKRRFQKTLLLCQYFTVNVPNWGRKIVQFCPCCAIVQSASIRKKRTRRLDWIIFMPV